MWWSLYYIPDGVSNSDTISANSSCWNVASLIVSTRCTESRWNLKLLRIANRRNSSINVCDPTFGTRLKKTIWFSARRVLFNERVFSVLIYLHNVTRIQEAAASSSSQHHKQKKRKKRKKREKNIRKMLNKLPSIYI